MYKRGDSWYSDFWYKGERYIESHGPVSKTVAKEKEAKFRADVASGDYIKSKNNPTFEKAIDEHLKKSEAENQPGTHRYYTMCAKHLREHYGKKRIRSIEGDEVLIRRYVKKRRAEIEAIQTERGRHPSQVSYTQINRELALLRAMFHKLIKAGKAKINPVSFVTLFEEKEKERIVSPQEIAKIIKTIEELDVRYHHLKDLIIIALNTAMRKNEILGMKQSWVDLAAGIINVPRDAQKRKRRDKRVPINSVVAEIVTRRMKGTPGAEYVFINPRTGTRYGNIYKSWCYVIDKAGLKGKPGVDKLRFHDLRHTAATRLAQGGKDIKFIAQYLGHSDVKTSARYIHYSDDDLKQGAEILAEVPTDFTTPKVVSS